MTGACCIGGVCIPYSAVLPFLALCFKWIMKTLGIKELPAPFNKLFGVPPIGGNKAVRSECCSKSGGCSSNDNKSEKHDVSSHEINIQATTTTVETVGNLLKISKMEQFHQVLNNRKKTVVKFTATWCKPCKEISPLIKSLAGEFTEKASFVEVDVDDHEDLAAEYKVKILPTIVVLDAPENNKTKIMGSVTGSSQIDSFIREHLS